MRTVALALLLVATACSRGTAEPEAEPPAAAQPKAPPSEEGAAPVTVRSFTEANEHIGKRIRVQGTAQREKLGDAVDTPHLNVVCLGPRFPNDRIGKTVTVVGKLDVTEEFQAKRGPGGEISQGTAGGVSLYVLTDCKLP